MKKQNLALVTGLGCLVFGGSAAIWAQNKPADTPEPAPTQSSTDAELEKLAAEDQGMTVVDGASAEAPGEVIQVTGSAIQRKEVSTPAPIVVLGRKEIEQSGLVSIAEVLQRLPEAANGATRQSALGGDGSTSINLRSLGSARTLVLINGRRMVRGGSGADGSVDTSTIPTGMIERIEILKDGASTVYGSDAIGGVVNIITRKQFTGVETTFQTGTSQRRDGTELQISAVGGYRNKRGGVVASVGFTEQRPVFARDRGWSKSYSYDFDTGAESPAFSATTEQGTLLTGAPQPGEVGNANWQAVRNQSDGKPGTFIRDPNAPGGFRPFNQAIEGFVPDTYMQLITPRRTFSAQSEGDYAITDRVTGFFEATFSRRESSREIAPNPLQTRTEVNPLTGKRLTFSGQNAFNPFGRDLVGGVDSVMRRVVEGGPRQFSDDMNLFRAVAGVDGTLPDRISDTWRWTASANYGRTQAKRFGHGEFAIDRLANALGATTPDGMQCVGADGQIIAGCVPMNLFGTISPEALAYSQYDYTSEGMNQLLSLQASANGRLLKTPWDGDLRLAFGVEYRREDGSITPDAEAARGNVTGVKISSTEGGYNVREGFAELQFVPVTGRALAKWLEINTSARAFDYSTFGSGVTWKVGSLWKVAGGLAARSTYSTAFRAPNVGDLFGTIQGFPQAKDPCRAANRMANPTVAANCAAQDPGLSGTFDDPSTQILTRSSGNPVVKAEKAKIFTAGATYESTFLEGLQASVDFYNIELTNTITTPSTQFVLDGCYVRGDQSFCEQVQRDASRKVSLVDVKPINVKDGGDTVRGLDLSLGLTRPVGPVTVSNGLYGAHLMSWKRRSGDRTIENAGIYDNNVNGALPDWKFAYNLAVQFKGFGVGTNLRYVGKFKECEGGSCPAVGEMASTPPRTVRAYFTGDATASYRFNLDGFGPSQFTFGVNNFLDKDPSKVYAGTTTFTSDPATYDYMGRFFYFRYMQSF